MRPLITCAVADTSVFDNVVTVQNTECLDLLLEVLRCGLFVGLQLLHSNQLASVITQWVITAKLDTAKVSLLKMYTVLVVDGGTHMFTSLFMYFPLWLLLKCSHVYLLPPRPNLTFPRGEI